MDTLGVGTFGKVKLAVHDTTHVRYACKILDKTLVRQRFLSEQVRKEIIVMQRLKHRNIVSLVRVLSTASKVHMIMELINGGELFEEIIRHKRLSEPYARFYFRQLIDGLQHCHEHGVYHRDLKPENILLDENKTLKISDFGLSSLRVGGGSSMASVTSTLNLHTQCGTPNYVAPEIVKLDSDGYSGAKVDAWACGIILYVLVSGALPFDADDTETLFKRIMRCDITYPPFFSNDLIDLVSNLLNIDPKRRYSLADVTRHPWFSGPVQDSMNGEDLDIAVPPPVYTPSMLSFTKALGQSDVMRETANHAEDKSQISMNHTSGRTSLLSQHMERGSLRTNLNRTTDSLDVGVLAKSMESKFAFEEVSIPVGQPMAPLLPAAIWDSGNPESVASSHNEILTLNTAGRARNTLSNGCRNSVDRFRSRVLSESEGSSSRNSDDDIVSELGAVGRLKAAPNGYHSSKVRNYKNESSDCRSVTTHQVCSWSHLDAHECAGIALGNDASSGSEQTVAEDLAMQHQLKTELGGQDAKFWRSLSSAHHTADTYSSFQSADSNMQKITFNASSQRHLKPGMAHSGDSGREFMIGSTPPTAEVNHSSVAEPFHLAFTGENAPSTDSDLRSSKLVRSRSHDGAMLVRPIQRRPRAKARHKVAANSHTFSFVEESPAHNHSRAHHLVNCSCYISDFCHEVRSRKILNNSQQHDGRTEKEQRYTVRFKEFASKGSQLQCSPSPDGDGIQNDLGKMSRYRMMKDFDMTPENDEYDVNSTALDWLWRGGLQNENASRRSAVVRDFHPPPWSSAAPTHEALTATMSGPMPYLSWEASRSEIEKGSTQQGAVSEHKKNTRIGSHTEINLTRCPNCLPSESGAANSNSSTSKRESDNSRFILVKSVSSPAITTNDMESVSCREFSENEEWPSNHRPPNIPMWTEMSVASAHNRMNRIYSGPAQDSEEFAKVRITTNTIANADAHPHFLKTSSSIPTLRPISGHSMGEMEHTIEAGEENSEVGPQGQLTANAPESQSTLEADVSSADLFKLGGSNDLLSSRGTVEINEDSGEDEKSEREDSLMSMSTEVPLKVQDWGSEVAGKLEVGTRWNCGINGDKTTQVLTRSPPPQSTADQMIETNGGDLRRNSCTRMLERPPASLRPVGLDMRGELERDTDRKYGLQDGNISREVGLHGDEEKSVSTQTMVSEAEELLNGESARTELGKGATEAVNEVDGGNEEGLVEDVDGNEEDKIEKVDSKRREIVAKKGAEHENDDGMTSRSTGGRSMTKKSSHSSSIKNVDTLGPFSMEIPGPRRTFTVSSSRREIGIGAILPRVEAVRRFWRGCSRRVFGNGNTQFYSVLKPEKCFQILGKLLMEDGCEVRGSSRELKRRYRIEWEKRTNETNIGGKIVVSAYDQALSNVVFKRSRKTNADSFDKFYSKVCKKYYERTRGKGEGGRCAT